MEIKTSSTRVLFIGAIGIVYGDIGTSVLYALKEVFANSRVPISDANVYGILSLLFWTLTVIVTFKYVTLVLRADNNGEGGLVAMLSLVSNALRHKQKTRRILLVVGVLGASLFYGDGIITPAISVLSAIEGLQILTPRAQHNVVPITLAVLLLLFLIQKRGTAKIAQYFGSIMVVWFTTIAILGLVQVIQHPGILRAVVPSYALRFVVQYPGMTFIILGALILCVTGAEALYADMGHFGRRPIRHAWFGVVMPALILNYFGQGALILRNPAAVQNPFFHMVPDYLLIPLVAVATVSTIIASQALISGAFSITRQLMQLGYLPRLRIRHTSIEQRGQIYIPFVNWTLFTAVILAVVYFQTSNALASAYGLAVCGLMLITTILTFFVIRYAWKLPLVICVLATGVFLSIDLIFLSSTLLKIPTGGWFPLLIALLIFALMTSWYRGQLRLIAARSNRSMELKKLLETIFKEPPARVSGTAVFLTSEPDQAPSAFLHNLKHNKVLHEENLFLTLIFHEQPWIPAKERVEIYPLGNDCFSIQLHYGYQDDPHVPLHLSSIRCGEYKFSAATTSYFIGRDVVILKSGERRFQRLQTKVFAYMHRNSSAISDYLKLPSNAVVELGGLIEV